MEEVPTRSILKLTVPKLKFQVGIVLECEKVILISSTSVSFYRRIVELYDNF